MASQPSVVMVTDHHVVAIMVCVCVCVCVCACACVCVCVCTPVQQCSQGSDKTMAYISCELASSMAQPDGA